MMRMIDADALIERLPEPKEKTISHYGAVADMVVLIASAPTVDPVKHSHWVLDPNGNDWGLAAWCCAACGSKNDALPVPQNSEDGALRSIMRFASSHYCPNCGAKMDEEVK